MLQQVHTYADLRKQIHDDLRIQHPEWVQPNGESPMCDSYEARLIETLDALIRQEPNKSCDRSQILKAAEQRPTKTIGAVIGD
jgi:hypothetical protein